MRRIVIGAAVVGLLLTGCADPQGTVEPGDPGGTVAAGAGAEPAGLLGAGTLAGTTQDTGATVEFTVGRVQIQRGCGGLLGSWRADPDGLFVAHLDGSTGCNQPVDPQPEWLTRATGFRADGADRALLDQTGAVVARLVALRSGSAAATASTPAGASNPALAQQLKRAFAPAMALPPQLTPAVRGTLVGRWVPAVRTGSADAYLELLADGAWRGSDGCNQQAGRWVSGTGGAVLAAGGMSTLIGCDGAAVGSWFVSARRAGLDGRILVLLDAQGQETGRLQPGR